MQGHGHHISIQKRADPSQSVSNILLNEFAYVLGIVGPFVSLPQLYSVWIEHDTSGVSILSWTAFALLSMFWCYYGLRHREKPLIISQALWTVMNFLVVAGVLIYR